jgi:hypothetical protein
MIFTGKMRFGNFDVTEAQFCMIGLMFITAAFGSGIWKIEVRRVENLRNCKVLG